MLAPGLAAAGRCGWASRAWGAVAGAVAGSGTRCLFWFQGLVQAGAVGDEAVVPVRAKTRPTMALAGMTSRNSSPSARARLYARTRTPSPAESRNWCGSYRSRRCVLAGRGFEGAPNQAKMGIGLGGQPGHAGSAASSTDAAWVLLIRSGPEAARLGAAERPAPAEEAAARAGPVATELVWARRLERRCRCGPVRRSALSGPAPSPGRP